MLKLCKDCKWCEKKQEPRFWGCNNPMNVKTQSLVDGKQIPIVYFCENARSLEELCGKNGAWFEPC